MIKKIVRTILMLCIVLVSACSYKEERTVNVNVNGENVLDAKTTIDTDADKLVNTEINSGGFAKIDFGHQNDKPVTWLVIFEDDEAKVLLSEKILDVHKYNEKDEKLDWEKTTLHEYLNTDFVNEYFTSEERANIMFTNDTENDLVTMLSINNLLDLYGGDNEDSIYYLKDGYYGDKDFYAANENLVAKPAELALYNEIDVFDNETFAEIMRTEVDKRYDFANGCAAYWLLNQADDTLSNAFLVTATGYIGSAEVNTDYIGIRPIIRIKK